MTTPDEGEGDEIEALTRTVVAQFESYVKLNKKVSPETLVSVNQIDEPARLADTVASHLAIKIDEKQGLLEISDVGQRLETVPLDCRTYRLLFHRKPDWHWSRQVRLGLHAACRRSDCLGEIGDRIGPTDSFLRIESSESRITRVSPGGQRASRRAGKKTVDV